MTPSVKRAPWEVDRLERGRPLRHDEIAVIIADGQTALRHATAHPALEALELMRDWRATEHDDERHRLTALHSSSGSRGWNAAVDAALMVHMGAPVIEALRELERDEATLEYSIRRRLWDRCTHLGKYGDDGEMQCRGADFRRAEIGSLVSHVEHARGTGPLTAMDLLG